MEMPIGDVIEGDVLAEAVRSAEGLVLLPSGTEITASQIRILTDRGVESVVVERNPEPPSTVTKAFDELDHMFSDVRGDQIMDSIHDVAHAMLERIRPQDK